MITTPRNAYPIATFIVMLILLWMSGIPIERGGALFFWGGFTVAFILSARAIGIGIEKGREWE